MKRESMVEEKRAVTESDIYSRWILLSNRDIRSKLYVVCPRQAPRHSWHNIHGFIQGTL